MMNMTLAYQAMRMLEPETGIKKEEILKGIRNTRWQGRMQGGREKIFILTAHTMWRDSCIFRFRCINTTPESDIAVFDGIG